jgi:hypothetical protein
MIGCKKRRIAIDDGPDGVMPEKFMCQKPAHLIPVPASGVNKFPVKGQIPGIKVRCG